MNISSRVQSDRHSRASKLLLTFAAIGAASYIYKQSVLEKLDVISIHQSVERHAPIQYQPASIEQYFMDNLSNLGWDKLDDPITCNVWSDPSVTTPEIYGKLMSYKSENEAHAKAISEFKGVPDLMKSIRKGNPNNQKELCKTVRLHKEGLHALFPSNELSMSSSGYIDPLLPPMRDMHFCNGEKIVSLDYLVHDFEAMCHKLKPHSRLILFDLGASLDYHGKNQPIVRLMKLYEKFGFYFDHIYAFEIREKKPEEVYGELLPVQYFPAYHWINVGVSAKEEDKLNPLYSILQNFDEDDLIVLKLDIDTPAIEVPLVMQLLKGKNDPYSKLIDQFYFEHHVHLGELAPYWKGSMNGSVKNTFELFHWLRKVGIPAHSWP